MVRLLRRLGNRDNSGSRHGAAYMIAIGAVAVMIVMVLWLSRTTTFTRWQTTLTSNDRKAMDCAEAAANLTFRVIQENMNDSKVFFKMLSLRAGPDDFFKSWFTMFRMPTAMAGGTVDPLSAKGAKDSAITGGIDFDLDLFSNTLTYGLIYKEGIKYSTDDPNSPLSLYLGELFTSMGGKTRVECKCKIARAYGILPKNTQYEIPGITVNTAPVSGWLGDLVNGIANPNLVIEFDLAMFIPEGSPLDMLPEIKPITVTVGVPPVPILVPVPVKKILQGLGLGSLLSWQSIAKLIFGDKLKAKIDLSNIKKAITDKIYDILPSQLKLFAGNIGWGVTIEKQGLLEVTTTVEFQPHFPNPGPTIKKTLVAQREFRVADIAPVAPDFSFFVANTTKTYEDANLEKPSDFNGDEEIKWNEGDGVLIVHNLPGIKEVFDTFSSILSFNLQEMNNRLRLPGRVRVKGTKKMTINLSMIDPGFSDMRQMEMLGLVVGHSHNIIPLPETVMFVPCSSKGWEWPHFNSGFWIPFIPRYNRTLLFGSYHIEPPFPLRVEGNLYKRFSNVKVELVDIVIPPVPPFFPGLAFFFPWAWSSDKEEPYGFCKFPPDDDTSKMSTKWDPTKAENLPENLYAPSQYLKKASHYYADSFAFEADIRNRSKVIDGKEVFICDGVTYVNDNLWFNRNLTVRGRGIIVAAGNVHFNGDIIYYKDGSGNETDEDGNPTMLSIIARSGALINKYRETTVHGNLYGDRGLMNTLGAKLNIYGNVCVNMFRRKDCSGHVEIHYQFNHAHSSLMSMIKDVAKYDPTRYMVSMTTKWKKFEFTKQ